MTGRPAIIDDLDKLKQLMRLKPSLADTAAIFDCSERTVQETIKREFDMEFRAFRERYMAQTRLSLIRKAVGKAEGGDNQMLIFCLKNICGWTDRQAVEVTGAEGGPIETLNVPVTNEDRLAIARRLMEIKS